MYILGGLMHAVHGGSKGFPQTVRKPSHRGDPCAVVGIGAEVAGLEIGGAGRLYRGHLARRPLYA